MLSATYGFQLHRCSQRHCSIQRQYLQQHFQKLVVCQCLTGTAGTHAKKQRRKKRPTPLPLHYSSLWLYNLQQITSNCNRKDISSFLLSQLYISSMAKWLTQHSHVFLSWLRSGQVKEREKERMLCPYSCILPIFIYLSFRPPVPVLFLQGSANITQRSLIMRKACLHIFHCNSFVDERAIC